MNKKPEFLERVFKSLAQGKRALFLFLLCVLFMMAIFPAVNRRYLSEGQDGHLELETTFDKAEYETIIGGWETATTTLAEAIGHYKLFLGLDCLFAVCYAFLWASLVALLTNVPGTEPSRWRLALFLSPAVAGIADIVENLFHLAIVSPIQSPADLANLSQDLIRYSHIATIIKFAFLVASLLLAVATRLFTVAGRVSKPRDRDHTRQLDQVIAEEGGYVKARRKQAGREFERAVKALQGEDVGPGSPQQTYRAMLEDEKRGRAGLTFSGGGIRSASFNLGLVQGLSKYGFLHWVDYLTSVSGGGFAAACMTTLLGLRQRYESGRKSDDYFFNTRWEYFPFNPRLKVFDEQGVALKPDVERLNKCEQVPLAPGDNTQLAYLRKMGNYLAPRLGLSRDILRGVGAFLMGIIYTVFIFLAILGAVSASHYLIHATLTPSVMNENIQIVAAAPKDEEAEEAEPIVLNLHLEDDAFVVDVPASPLEEEEEEEREEDGGLAVGLADLPSLVIGTYRGKAEEDSEGTARTPAAQYGYALGIGFALSLLICYLITSFYRSDPGRKYALDSWESPVEDVSTRTYLTIGNIRTFAVLSCAILLVLTVALWAWRYPLLGQTGAELTNFYQIWALVFGLFALAALWFILVHLVDYTWVRRGLPDQEWIDGLVVKASAGLFVWVVALTIAWLRFAAFQQGAAGPQLFWVWLPAVFTLGSLAGLIFFRLLPIRYRVDVYDIPAYRHSVGPLGRLYFWLLGIAQRARKDETKAGWLGRLRSWFKYIAGRSSEKAGDADAERGRSYSASIWGGSQYRGVFWTLQGLTLVALLVCVVSAALILPHFFAIAEEGEPKTAVPAATALLSAIWASLIAYFNGKADFEPKTWIQKIVALPAAVRNQVLGALVIVLNLSVIFVFEGLIDAHATAPLIVLWIGAAALGLFWVTGRFVDFNHLTPHYFFRDRAADAFLKTEVVSESKGRTAASSRAKYHPGQVLPYQDKKAIHAGQFNLVRDDRDTKLWWVNPSKCSSPYHLVVASMNMPGSWDLQYKDRKSQHFVFSKLYCGSDLTGYVKTGAARDVNEKYRRGMTKYSAAIAISGAALASSLGYLTFFAQAFMMTLLNVRLGLWLISPELYASDAPPTDLRPEDYFTYETRAFWPVYLWDEARGKINERRPLINVSDGGHTGDNVALYPLFQRRCKIIIAGDASQDPEGMCSDLFRVIRQVRMDLNIEVKIDVDGLQPAEYDAEKKTGKPGKYHCAVGEITYPAEYNAQGEVVRDEETGWLIYFKPAVTADVPSSIKQYWETHPTQFPHPTTVDQFFNEEQFEAQRHLGEFTVRHTLERLRDYYQELIDEEKKKDDWTDEKVKEKEKELAPRPDLIKALLDRNVGAVLKLLPQKPEEIGALVEAMIKDLQKATTL